MGERESGMFRSSPFSRLATLRDMARPLRLEFAGTLYHVTDRGDGREGGKAQFSHRSIATDTSEGHPADPGERRGGIRWASCLS